MIAFDPTVDATLGFPISLSDDTGQRVMVDDRFAELLRRPKEQLLSAKWQTIAHPLDMQNGAGEAVCRVMQTGTPTQIKWRHLRGDGTWMVGDVYLSRVVMAHSRRRYLQGNFLPEPETVPAAVPSASDCIDYIESMSRDMRLLAESHSLSFIQHLLAMVEEEAARELLKRAAAAESKIVGSSLALH